MACRVLIVEDETIVADQLESLLAGAGHSVCGKTRSVAGALLLSKTELPDIVVMAVKLASMADGIDATAAMFETLGCGMVFIAAQNDPATHERIKAATPTAEVLSKPVQWPALEAACARVSPCVERQRS